jgi:hypothetical protein
MFNPFPRRSVRHPLVFLLAAVALSSLPVSAQEEKGAGAVLSPEAKAKDVGLAIYPGSKAHKEKDDDSPSANFGLWGGGSAFKLAILKMETVDAPEKVAAYYRKALARYGTVLDCSKSSRSSESTARDVSSEGLTCGDDKPESGGMLFKSGTKEEQHIVAIQPWGNGTLYQLIYVGAWGSGGKK